MGYSLYRKGMAQTTPQSSGSASGAAGSNQSTVLLNKDWLTEEYKLHIIATQAATVAPTAGHPENAISSLTLEYSGGKNGGNGVRINLSGFELYQIMRFTEDTPAPVLTPGAGGGANATLDFTIDIHVEFDEAYNDLMAASFTGDYSSIKLTINWANSGVFTGTMTGNISYQYDIEAVNYPKIPPEMQAPGLGAAKCTYQSTLIPISGAGNVQDMLLKTGVKARFIGIKTDVAGTADDAVLDTIQMLFGGLNYQTTFAKLKQQNALRRNGFTATGFAVIDFGDDPTGWLDLTQLNEARLKSTALKAGNVYFSQVSMEDLGS